MSNYNQLKITYENGSRDVIELNDSNINFGQYQNRNIAAVEVPEIVTNIGPYAFCDNPLSSITLNEGLAIIGNQAFQHGTYSAITIPSTVWQIALNAFNISEEQEGFQAGDLYVTCLATTPPSLNDSEFKTFGNPDYLQAIYVPAESVEDYKAAEYWDYYADKIQAIPTPPPPTPTTGFSTLDIVSAYVGTEIVERMYMSDELVWGGEPGPDYSKMPLTFNIISGGTINWRADNIAYTKEIHYSINDGEWTSIVSTTAGTPITLSTGDIIKFKGDGAISTGQNKRNRFRDGTIVFEVYGNIMSLIDSTGYTTATTAADHSFRQLFNLQTGLTSAENLVLPATTIGTNVYKEMFKGCTGLTIAPELPAETLAQSCYMGMFNGCTSLTAAPELPATTLAQECYREMFSGCTSLTTAPSVLPATTLADACYQYMFRGCSSLNYIKCLATNISAGNSTYNWVNDVASFGTFVKHPNASWSSGVSGIPTGWIIEDAA